MHFPKITRETLAHYIMQTWAEPGIKLPESQGYDQPNKDDTVAIETQTVA